MEADVDDGMRGRGDGGDDVRGASPRRVDRDVCEAVPLEEGERVRLLVRLHPGAVAELDERHERVEQVAGGDELVERLSRLLDAWVVLEEDAAHLPERSSGASASRNSRNAWSRSASRCPVISPDALTWKVKSGGVRSAHFWAVSGDGSA